MSGNFSEGDKEINDSVTIDWEKDFNFFLKNMRNKIIRNIFKKGYPTKDRLKYTSDEYFKNKIKEHLELNHYSDVANFAFMLYQKNGEKV